MDYWSREGIIRPVSVSTPTSIKMSIHYWNLKFNNNTFTSLRLTLLILAILYCFGLWVFLLQKHFQNIWLSNLVTKIVHWWRLIQKRVLCPKLDVHVSIFAQHTEIFQQCIFTVNILHSNAAIYGPVKHLHDLIQTFHHLECQCLIIYIMSKNEISGS